MFVNPLYDSLPEGAAIAVAVSGGADSMALVLLADAWAKQHNGRIIALTVDHGLRPESATEADTVHSWLTQRKIEHHILRWEGDKPSSNLQSLAREARYALMTSWCKQHQITYLLTAHHQQDQAETVLLRLERGSGVDGLSGIPVQTERDGIILLRPLLLLTPEQLRLYLHEQNQNWIEDPSNQNTRFSRVRMRQWLAQQEDKALITSRLADTAHHLSRTRSYLEEQTHHAFQTSVTLHPEGYALFTPHDYHEEIGLRLLSLLLRLISGHDQKPRFEQLWHLYQALQQPDTYTAHTLEGCLIAPYQGKILFCREYAALPASYAIESGSFLRWDNRFDLKITLHTPLPLTIVPLGQEGYLAWKKEFSSHSAFETIQRLPKFVLYGLPVVRSLENIVAIPHIQYKDERYVRDVEILYHRANLLVKGT